jgi:1-acyl-sn-glycerol-3-phosphate acyltransferase
MIGALITCLWALLGLVTWPLSPSGRLYLAYARIWSRMVLAVSGARCEGRLPPDFDGSRPVIFMANHESLYDILALFATIPMPVRMIAKKELRRIPVFGWSMWMAGFVFVDRSRRQEAFGSLDRAAREVRHGKAIVIFPEGTRGDGVALGRFKRGAFYLAVRAGVPVVPVGIAGSGHVLPKHTLRPRSGRIVLRFGARILPDASSPDRDASSPGGLDHSSPEARDALQARVRAAIETLVGDAREALARQ